MTIKMLTYVDDLGQVWGCDNCQTTHYIYRLNIAHMTYADISTADF